MPEVGNDKFDPELRAIRDPGWDILSKLTQKDFLLNLETDGYENRPRSPMLMSS